MGLIVSLIVLLIITIMIGLWVNHNRLVRNEAGRFPPPGKVVEVNEKGMHVYTQGDGDLTLVFMAGHGTSNPALDFKPLWMQLADEYRIAVVEKSGYGWSETTNSPRDIGTILEETRTALNLSGENGPYILFPHSMSGLEAIYWAQQYPNEVKAIIGLDPLTPASMEVIPDPQKSQLYFMYLISRIGLSRLIPESKISENLPLMDSDDLTDEEKEQYLAVFYKSAFTRDMLREVQFLRENVQVVAENDAPVNTPMFFFISNDQDVNVAGWMQASTDYLDQIAIGEFMQLDASHYLHYEKAELIAKTTKSFINQINQNQINQIE